MTFLCTSNLLSTSRNFVIILILAIQTCLFLLNKKKKNGKLLFLDIEISLEKGKFITTVYREPSFRGVHILFKDFLLTVHKFGIVSSLAYFCFKICSDWTKFYEELSFLKQDFF